MPTVLSSADPSMNSSAWQCMASTGRPPAPKRAGFGRRSASIPYGLNSRGVLRSNSSHDAPFLKF